MKDLNKLPSKNSGLAIYWGKTLVKHVFDKGSEYKKNILEYISSCKLPKIDLDMKDPIEKTINILWST